MTDLPVVAPKNMRRFPWRNLALGVVGFMVLVLIVPPLRNAAATVVSRVILFVSTPFAPSTAGFEELPDASRVLAMDKTEIGVLGTELRDPVKLADLPPHVPHAVLAAEDANFYEHSGVDPSAVLRAMVNVAAGGTQGGSTITQQLAKLNYTGSQRSYTRKFKEVLYASRLEKKYTKDQLLERYLNQVYFGESAYGIAAAAETFYGVAPQDLSVAQAATLAAKIRAPSTLDPYTNADRVLKRRDQVLKNMVDRRWLVGEEIERALKSTLGVVERRPAATRTGSKAPHFLSFVGREAATLADLGDTPDDRRRRILTGGYTVETTLDLKAYDAAVEAARQVLGEPDDPTTAIVSVQPGDGAIRVLFGGLDPKLEFDPASQGRRQPGSSFKPYVYLAMLKSGIDPRAEFDSSAPRTFDCRGTSWPVRNYEGSGGGMVAVDTAMADSINVVFAEIMTKVGPAAVADVANMAGISKEELSPPECAMALGGLRRGVSPLEHATGFATFAAKGKYAQPYSIARIRDRNGKVIYDHDSRTSQAFTPTEVGVLTASLEGVVKDGTGTAAAIGRPLAGKTGTTENYGNAWFIGYVPQLATAVWVGRPEGDTPMRDVHGISVTGGSFPARIFSRYMRVALEGVPVQDLYRASPDELPQKNVTSTRPAPPPPPPPSSTVPATTVATPPPTPATTAATTPQPVVTATTRPPVTAPPAPPTTAQIILPVNATTTTLVSGSPPSTARRT